jgi:drug/metabolite transporter (DMT)-like permease
MDKKNIFLFLLIAGTAFWGISFSVTKLAIQQASFSTFLCYRFLVATAILSVVFWKHLKAVTWNAVKTGAYLALPLTAGICLQTCGIKHSNASQCAFVAGMCVVIIPLLKIILYRAVAPVKIWIAASVAMAGLFVISVKSDLSIGIGDLYTIAGAVAFALYLIKVEKHSSSRNIVSTIVPMFATCTIITCGLSLADSSAVWLPESQSFWTGIVFCAMFSTAYMYTISNIAQRYISAERVSIIYLFEPVFGAIAAFFILGEGLSWKLLLGGTLILAATLISELNVSGRMPVLKRNR